MTYLGRLPLKWLPPTSFRLRQANLSSSYLKGPYLKYFELTHLISVSFNLLSTAWKRQEDFFFWRFIDNTGRLGEQAKGVPFFKKRKGLNLGAESPSIRLC